jgi:hypothetical protein
MKGYCSNYQRSKSATLVMYSYSRKMGGVVYSCDARIQGMDFGFWVFLFYYIWKKVCLIRRQLILMKKCSLSRIFFSFFFLKCLLGSCCYALTYNLQGAIGNINLYSYVKWMAVSLNFVKRKILCQLKSDLLFAWILL